MAVFLKRGSPPFLRSGTPQGRAGSSPPDSRELKSRKRILAVGFFQHPDLTADFLKTDIRFSAFLQDRKEIGVGGSA